MRRIVVLSVLMFVLSSLMLYAGEWTGYISDAKCAAKGESAEHSACAKSCIDRGEAAVFVSGGKVYTLDKQDEAKKLAGEKVVLKGEVSEDGASIKVESIEKVED